MGSFSDRYKERYGGSSSGGSSQSPGSQGAYTTGQNAQRLTANMQLAGKLVGDPRLKNVHGADRDIVKEAAINGVAEKSKTLGLQLLKLVSGPFKTAQLLVNDMLGGSAKGGYEDPSIWDYGKTLLGQTDEAELKARTGLRLTGSQTLEFLGWEEAEEGDWANRIGRGLAHFALETAIDPLTYVTFGMSGLGRKVAAQGARVFENKTAGRVMSFLDDAAAKGIKKTDDVISYAKTMDDDVLNAYEKKIVNELDVHRTDLLQNSGEQLRALKQYDGSMPLVDTVDELAVRKQIYEDVIEPAISRNFKQVNELALPHIPAYLRGGARLGFPNLPFVPKELLAKAWDIPGTRGSGRWVKNHMANFLNSLPGSSAAKQALKGVKKATDWDEPLFRMLKEGRMDSLEWGLAMTARDTIFNKEAVTGYTAWMRGQADHLGKLADSLVNSAKFADRTAQDVTAELARAVQTRMENPGARVAGQYPEAVEKTLDSMAEKLRETADDLFKAYAALDEDFAKSYIEGYLPHLPSQAGHGIVSDLIKNGANALNRGMRDSETDAGVHFLSKMAASMGYAGSEVDEAMGSVRFQGREGGKMFTALKNGGGPLLIGPDAQRVLFRVGAESDLTGTKFLSAQEMNEILEPTIREMAEKSGIKLPKDWDGKFFSEDPFQVMQEYARSMTDAIQQHEFVKAMKVLGLVRHSGKKLDMYTVMDSMRNAKMQVFEAATEKGGVRVLKRPLATVKAGTGKALARMGHADDIENVGKVARLYEKLTGVPKKEWNSLMGGVKDTAEVSGRLQGLRAARNTTTVANRFANLTDLTIVKDHKTGEVILDIASVSEDAMMNASNLQMADAARMTWDALDEEFTRGSLKGMLSDEGIQQLYDAGMTAQTSHILHDYLSAKMSRLGDDFLATAGSSDIAELGSARHLYNQVEEAIDRFIQEYSTVVDSAGEVLSWGPKLGDDTAVAKIAEIEELIRELGEAGYDDVAEKLGSFGKFTDVGEWGFVKPKDLKLGGSALDDMIIQRDIANWMRNMATNSMVMNTPVGAAAAKMATNAFMKNWRGLVTLARPTFHIRNAVGAATMNMFMGVKNAQYQRLNRGVHAFRKGMQEAVMDDGTVRSYKDMMDHALSYVDEADRGAFRSMWDEGVLSGYVDTEFRQQIGASAVRPEKWEKIVPWDVDKFVLGKIGASTMQNIEDYARGALFLEFYDEALEGAGGFAREMVNAVHFDYAHLTPAEEFAKSIIPFFVWMRRNIPRQLELMVEQPWMMQRYQHAMTALNDNLGGNEQVPGTSDPMWASANMAGTDIFVGKDTPFWMRVFIDPDLPLGDVQDIPNPLNINQLTEFANGQLGPHITLITDMLAQRDYNDVNIPAPFNQVLGALSATGLYDTTTDGDVRWSYVQQSLFDLAAPWWGEVVNPLMAGGSDPNDQLRMGQQPGQGWSPQGAITSTAWMGARGLGAKLSTPKDTTRDAGFTRAQLEQIAKEMGLYGR